MRSRVIGGSPVKVSKIPLDIPTVRTEKSNYEKSSILPAYYPIVRLKKWLSNG